MNDLPLAQAPALDDLDTLVEAPSASVPLRHPISGAPTAASVTLAGPEHPARRAAIFARMRARRQEMAATGKLSVSDPAEDEAEETELLATCTLGWSGLRRGGVELPYSPVAARELLADGRYRWLRDQVKTELDRRELFIGGSAPA